MVSAKSRSVRAALSRLATIQPGTALYRMAVVGTKHNPVIRQHYAKKLAAGRSPMNAIGHCMAKALDLVWGVWRSGRDFDPALRSKDLTRTYGI
ncbi:MAG: hypothetical protein JF885_12715 [Candidatus Dormibacteraeota bacterium]|nr:hypothetical protein [Candidatus Dormibacteraeota bacterium]